MLRFIATEDINPRWALPDVMATWKPSSYAWQDEFRFVFSLTDALDFEKVQTRVLRGERQHTPDPSPHLPRESREFARYLPPCAG